MKRQTLGKNKWSSIQTLLQRILLATNIYERNCSRAVVLGQLAVPLLYGVLTDEQLVQGCGHGPVVVRLAVGLYLESLGSAFRLGYLYLCVGLSLLYEVLCLEALLDCLILGLDGGGVS